MLRIILPFLFGVVVSAFSVEWIHWDHRTTLIVSALHLGVLITAMPFLLFYRKQHYFGLAVWVILFVLGSGLTLSRSSEPYPDRLVVDMYERGSDAYIMEIVDEPQIKPNSIKATVHICDSDLNQYGQVLMYFKKDSVSEQLKYGQQFVVATTLQPVNNLGNPNEFDYKRYLRFNGISHRAYIRSNAKKWLSDGRPGVWGYLYGLRSRLIQKFRDGGLEGEELAVASALVLGHRADLDRELMSAYAGAGATHVLAVSGLHVGIVYVILNMLLKFLDKKRYGKIVKTVLLVVALFGYAGLTGLSASVFRAATMFAFVAVGKAIDRNTNIFNTLAASAFVLIAFDPMIIMQVGFQLSYLAVIGIVVIHPILFNLVTVNNRIGDWAWSITCVSIAAQVATFPLGLLYFHQFPNLFLLSNLLVIPAATGILYLGFLLFTFSFWNPTLLFFGKLLNWLISSLNTVVVYIEEIPYSVLTGIDISTIETLIIYAAIVSWLMFLLHRIRPAFYVALGLSVIFMVLQCFEVHRQKTQHFLTVYNVKGHTAISVVEGTKVLFLSDEELYTNEQSMLFHIRHHWWRLGIEEEEFVPISTDISNRELSIGTRNLVLLDLTNPPDGLKIRASQKDDLVCVLHSIKWNSIDNLKQLASSRIVIPDRFGPKVLERIKTMNESGNLSMLSDQGAFKLCED